MTEAVDFDATLWRPDGRGSATFVTLPFDVRADFGRARCPVRVTINGHTWRTTTQVHGDDYHVEVGAEARAAAAVDAGDTVRVQVRKDDAVRSVDVPPELAARLRTDLDAKEAFESLAPSHQREYSRWIADATQPQTRVRRVHAALVRLKTRDRRPRSA